MMNIQVLPLSPPHEKLQEPLEVEEEEEEKKRVKFCLPTLQTDMEEEEEEKEKEENLCSPNIDIHAHMVPDTILVALLNRDQEMKELVQHNQPFFKSIQLQLGKKEWHTFEKILYSPRQQYNDYQWMMKIKGYLNRIPTSFITFKDLVGCMMVEDGEDEDEEKAHSEPTFFQHINVCHIRHYPEKLNDFKSSYPQFFINCQQVLSKKAMATLESTLFTPSSSLSDQQWKSIINQILSCHQNLMDQLKEIIAYEINDD
ncbi:hypothetical protein BJ944DRAFT_274142 [Cunninghamella echinulata]|nr:hypothetical protein BJ944DRAFT_274142 [Cunninghamella echinulata]